MMASAATEKKSIVGMCRQGEGGAGRVSMHVLAGGGGRVSMDVLAGCWWR